MPLDENKAVEPTTAAEPAEPPLKRAPALYIIVVFKLLKGLLFFSSAIAIYALSDNNLPEEFQKLVDFLRIHPGNRFFQMLAAKVANITELQMIHAAIGTCVYSMFSLIEGTGMAFRAGWAGWLAIGESAFFIPLECRELLKSFSWYMFGVMICNVVIVWYLYQNREWLFHHHHFHHKPKTTKEPDAANRSDGNRQNG